MTARASSSSHFLTPAGTASGFYPLRPLVVGEHIFDELHGVAHDAGDARVAAPAHGPPQLAAHLLVGHVRSPRVHVVAEVAQVHEQGEGVVATSHGRHVVVERAGIEPQLLAA